MIESNQETWITITNSKKKTDLHVRFEDNPEQHYVVNLTVRGLLRDNQDAVKANSLEDIIQWWLSCQEETIDPEGYVNLPEDSELVEVW